MLPNLPAIHPLTTQKMQLKNHEATHQEEDSRKVVIIGAGVFGLSTALHLLEKGYKVTVLERASEVPARDGAGYDLNKGECSD